ncbi:MAG: S24 family peptidase [Peptostreptococcaceae bacterium]|nr:S24 family peptidase [Peptostreptococcaceae bacterium]
MSILDRLKEKLEEQNYTLASLERTLGFGQGTIRKWDTNYPSYDKLVKVANLLNVDVGWLITGETPNTSEDYSEIEQYLIDMFRKLPEREQVKIEGILEWKLQEQEDKENKETLKAPDSSLPRVEEKIIPYNAYIKEETPTHSKNNEETQPREVLIIGDTAAGSFINAIANSYFEETVIAKHKKTDFAVKVKGDSMEPLIKKGQIVEVQDTQFVSNGEIVIVSYNEGITCKKIYFRPNHEIELRSINEEYEPIFIKLNEFDIENNSFRVIGRVLL